MNMVEGECNSNVVMDDQDDNLSKELRAHNEYFKQMINLVPANFYFDQESIDKTNKQKSAVLDLSLSKGKNKRAHGRELSERAQKKRMKYDPTLNTVIDIQEALIQQEEREKELKQKGKKKKNSDDDDDDDSSLKSSAESLEELHGKLQRKIDALREKRGAVDKGNTLLKRKQRKERKMKAKMKQKANKIKGQTADVANCVKAIDTPFKSPSKPIFNKEGKMVFSKFEFSESPCGKEETNMPSGSKKYKKLLEQVEQRKHKLQQLKESDAEKARSMEEKVSWQNAIKRAEGTKVRDNPELLKETMKRIEKRKQKSHNKWQERNERVQQKMQDRQDKRKKHIQVKKQAKVDKKIKKAKKRGRMIPGF